MDDPVSEGGQDEVPSPQAKFGPCPRSIQPTGPKIGGGRAVAVVSFPLLLNFQMHRLDNMLNWHVEVVQGLIWVHGGWVEVVQGLIL